MKPDKEGGNEDGHMPYSQLTNNVTHTFYKYETIHLIFVSDLYSWDLYGTLKRIHNVCCTILKLLDSETLITCLLAKD